MYKFAFTYLVRQDNQTWNDFECSLKLLNKTILKKLKSNYKILIYCEGEPNKKVKNFLDYLVNEEKIKITIIRISLISYVKRKAKINM